MHAMFHAVSIKIKDIVFLSCIIEVSSSRPCLIASLVSGAHVDMENLILRCLRTVRRGAFRVRPPQILFNGVSYKHIKSINVLCVCMFHTITLYVVNILNKQYAILTD